MSLIPRTIHQTVRSLAELTPVQSRVMRSWREFNPDHQVVVYEDADVRAFMEEEFPHLVPVFERLRHVQKYDLFRYLVVLRFGGWYADSDAECHRPISEWDFDRERHRFVAGVELDLSDQPPHVSRDAVRRVMFLQWCFGAVAGHPILEDGVKMVVANSFKPDYFFSRHRYPHTGTMDRTGAGPFTDAITVVLVNRGLAPADMASGGEVGDLLIYPYFVLGAAPTGSSPLSLEETLRRRYVSHGHEGSWILEARFGSGRWGRMARFLSRIYRRLKAWWA